MKKSRRTVWALGPGLLLSALVVSFTPGTAAAEVIRLRTGEIVKGRPIEKLSTETLLVIEDATTGNLRKLRWSVVERADRERILKAWGRLAPTIEPVMGHVLVLTLENGQTTEVRGLLTGETKTHDKVMSLGRLLEIEKARVKSIREQLVDPRAIWTPAQIVRDYIKRLPKSALDESAMPTSATHLRIARYAEELGAYEDARVHYEEASRDKNAAHHKFAMQKLAAMKALLAEGTALAELRRARMALQLRSFRKARTRIRKIEETFTKPGAHLAKQIRETKERFEGVRERHFAFEAGRMLPKLAQRLIDARVREHGGGITDATAWSRRELPDALFEALAKHMRRQDDVKPAEASAFWKQRPRRSWRTVTYGSGSFIILGPGPRPPRKGKAKGRGIPRPPTRDEWWDRSDLKTRSGWLFAYFVEHSELFDTTDARGKPCAQCGGTGFERHRLQNGLFAQFLCRRCAGTQTDRALRYR